jgi:hypothetical protein
MSGSWIADGKADIAKSTWLTLSGIRTASLKIEHSPILRLTKLYLTTYRLRIEIAGVVKLEKRMSRRARNTREPGGPCGRSVLAQFLFY